MCYSVCVDDDLRETCESLDYCVKVLDTLAASTVYSIPTLSDMQLTVACRYVSTSDASIC